MPLRIALTGAAGRMGRRICALAATDPEVNVCCAMESSGSPHVGDDAGVLAGIGASGLRISKELNADFDVLIDFSSTAGTVAILDELEARKRPIVIGTTGHDAQQIRRIQKASESIAVLKAANMSVGVNVILRLVREAAALFDASYDVEITEAHHRFKVDAPSGTALALRDAVVKGRELAGTPTAGTIHGRSGQTGARTAGEIGVHAVRLGDTVGEHSVAFGALGETVTINHSAHSRDTFAAGAIRAAKWLAGRKAGLYGMDDVLFGANS